MSTSEAASLEKLIRKCGLDWMIDWYVTPNKAIDFWLGFLAEVNSEIRQRFGNDAPNLSPEVLANEYARNPLKITAFLQALSGRGSPQMLVMAWRITIQGFEVESIKMDYLSGDRFSLRVQLRSPSSATAEIYESDNVSDAKLIRHFGTFQSDGTPRIRGFYPLRLETK